MNPTKVVIAAAVVGAVAGCAAPKTASRPSTTSTSKTTSTTTVTTTAATTTTLPPLTTTTTIRRTTIRPTTTTTAGTSTTRPRVAAGCPPSLPASLAYTGSARQLITVSAAGYSTTYASVELWQRAHAGACWQSVAGPWTGRIGKTGFSDHHREGDGSTPTGYYGLGPVIYGNATDPGVQEAYHHLLCGDWWDEDPGNAGYNTFQHVPCGTTPSWAPGSGRLWTETAAYPSFAVIDYNTGPVVQGAGSAIFLHSDTGSATVGCVSVPRPDLDQTLRWLDPADSPAFVMGPTGEISRF